MRPRGGRKADQGAGNRRNPVSHCKSCGLSVVWLQGGYGSIILDATDEAIRCARGRLNYTTTNKELRSHMETCPDRERWRRKPLPAERKPRWQ